MKNIILTILGISTVSALLFSCTGSDSDNQAIEESTNISEYSPAAPVTINLLTNHIQNNDAAYIPSQCYTRTKGTDNTIHNPCFSCHTAGQTPNYIDDSEFQTLYDFRTYSRTNRWTNLFKDRTAAVNSISDAAMMDYIRTSNYFDENNNIILAQTLSAVPQEWDYNQNGSWDGYTPDCYFNFDSEGFDKNPNTDIDTGWRAFSYTPFLGTFWPTNGSTDDVIMRLPETMRQDTAGTYSRNVYKLNLAIVEAMITRKNITIDSTDENLYNVDLNRNGVLDIATEVSYDWAPTEGRNMSYVGKAKTLQESGDLHLAAGLYPEGTEFLHTVRYIDVDENGIKLSERIKELRYGKKNSWNTYSQLYNAAMGEELEAEQFPDRLRTIIGNAEEGVINGLGWRYQGFIEDLDGSLRPQSYEESMNCVGCHSGVGVTTDSSFAFPRKLTAENDQAGWYHWSQKGFAGLAEPQWTDGTWEYTKYLTENQSANEFRDNDEVVAKFFDSNGNLKEDQVAILHSDIAHLLSPSAERAMKLNKAYKIIVDEQSYIYGRDPHIAPVTTSWDIVPIDETTGVETPVIAN